MSDAIMGTFVSIKTMADGSPRMVIDMQCTLQEIAAMGLTPGAAFGVVRLTQESTITAAQKETQEAASKERPGNLCIMACNFCDDPIFLDWVCEKYHIPNKDFIPKEIICGICGIESRKELDHNAKAAEIFHKNIRKPFIEWRDSK